jgi:hypothetical protein
VGGRTNCDRPRMTSALVAAVVVLLTALPGTAVAAALEEADVSIQTLRERSRARITFSAGRDYLEVFLFADNEKEETLRGASCPGTSGSKRFSGNYRLIALKNRAFHGALAIGDRSFTERRTEEIKVIRFAESNARLIAISQLPACNTETMEVFRVDGRGAMHKVRMRQRNGVEANRIAGPAGGKLAQLSGNELTYCRALNSESATLCTHYLFENGRLLETFTETHSPGQQPNNQ